MFNYVSIIASTANTTSGNKVPTQDQLQRLFDGDYVTSAITISGSDILALDYDLLDRLAVKDIRYYFTSASSSGTVMSGISMYFKEHITDAWMPLTVITGSGYYTTTSGNFFPRQIRLRHTVSGTAVSGSLTEFEINSRDDIVDFGSTGTKTEEYLSETAYGESSVKAVPIYNNSNKNADAYVFIQNTGTDADTYLRICDSATGTFSSISGTNVDYTDFSGYKWRTSSAQAGELRLAAPSTSLFTPSVGSVYRSLFVPGSGIDDSYAYYGGGVNWKRVKLSAGTEESLATSPLTLDNTTKFAYSSDFNRIYIVYTISGTGDMWFRLRYYDISANTWSSELCTQSGIPSVHTAWCPGLAYVPKNRWPGDGLASVTCMPQCGNTPTNIVTPFLRFKISNDGITHTGSVITPVPNSVGAYFGEAMAGGTYTDNMYEVSAVSCFVDSNQLGAGISGSIYATGSCCSKYYNYNRFDIATQTWSYIDHNLTTKTDDMETDHIESPSCQAGIAVIDNVLYTYNTNNSTSQQYIYTLNMSTLGWTRVFLSSTYLFSVGTNGRTSILGNKFNSGIKYLQLFGTTTPYLTSFQLGTYTLSGTWTSDVCYVDGPSYFYIKYSLPTNTNIAATSTTLPTIAIRSSDTAPDSYRRVCTWRYVSGIEWWNTELYNGRTGDTLRYLSLYANQAMCSQALNPFNATYFMATLNCVVSNSWDLYIWDRDGNDVTTKTISLGADYYQKSMIWNINNNLYVMAMSYDNVAGRIYRISSGGTVLGYKSVGNPACFQGGKMCLAGDHECIWYVDRSLNYIYRMDQLFNNTTTITNMTDVYGICEDGSGGIWAIDFTGNLVNRYDEDGTLLGTVTDEVYNPSFISKDGSGGFWIYDAANAVVKHYNSSGYLVRTIVVDIAAGICADSSGIWVISTASSSLKYYNNAGALLRTFTGSYTISYYSEGRAGGTTGAWWPTCAFGKSADVGGCYPGTADAVWGTLAWNEVGLNSNFLPRKKYHQLRLTFRTSDSSYTPAITGIYLEDPVPLYNIPSKGTKDIYIKTVIPDSVRRDIKTGKIRVWFDMEE